MALQGPKRVILLPLWMQIGWPTAWQQASGHQ